MKMLGSAIVLLGTQIPLSTTDGEAPAGDFGASLEKTEPEEAEKVTVEGKVTEETDETEAALTDEHDLVDMETENIQPAITSKNGEIGNTEQSDANLKEKTSKKPDKILPCPRCKSMETKFCYYNNYNVNQPRYFCKACQRYWTSGGTMRSMPIGAGRRKNKNSPSPYRHITVSETLQLVRTNEKVLSFGSLTSGLSHGEKGLNGNLIGFEKIEGQGFPASQASHEISDDCSSVSSLTAPESVEEGVMKSCHKPYFQDLNCSPSSFFPGVSWPYCPPGFPLSFYGGSYWNPPWFSGQVSSPSSSRNSSDDGEQRKKHKQGSVLVPKTLRINNPSDAAKSSIWATLGIKNELIGPGNMFKDFQSKGVERTCLAERSSVLQANPAALTRSLAFHETA